VPGDFGRLGAFSCTLGTWHKVSGGPRLMRGKGLCSLWMLLSGSWWPPRWRRQPSPQSRLTHCGHQLDHQQLRDRANAGDPAGESIFDHAEGHSQRQPDRVSANLRRGLLAIRRCRRRYQRRMRFSRATMPARALQRELPLPPCCRAARSPTGPSSSRQHYRRHPTVTDVVTFGPATIMVGDNQSDTFTVALGPGRCQRQHRYRILRVPERDHHQHFT